MQKPRCLNLRETAAFNANSSASSAARLSVPGIRGAGEHEALTETAHWLTDPRLCAPRFPGVYLFGNSETN
jgi:hypothetical protein